MTHRTTPDGENRRPAGRPRPSVRHTRRTRPQRSDNPEMSAQAPEAASAPSGSTPASADRANAQAHTVRMAAPANAADRARQSQDPAGQTLRPTPRRERPANEASAAQAQAAAAR